jgi:hypothetical protein
VPDACAAIVLKAMAKDPSQRFANAQAMLDALQSLSQTQSQSPPPNLMSAGLTPPVVPVRTEGMRFDPTRIAAAPPLKKRAWRSAWVLLPALVAVTLFLFALTGRPWSNHSPGAGDWKPLFNGSDLTGWWKLKSPPGEWAVEDRVLVGRMPQTTSDPSSYLLTDRNDYANFECRAEVRISKAGNSGIFFRCNSEPSLPQGLEAHLGTDECGDLHRTWAHGEQPLKVSEHPISVPPQRWTNVEISVRGPHIVIRVDGVTTADVTEHPSAPARGYIALQVFDPGTQVSVRKLEIRELP